MIDTIVVSTVFRRMRKLLLASSFMCLATAAGILSQDVPPGLQVFGFGRASANAITENKQARKQATCRQAASMGIMADRVADTIPTKISVSGTPASYAIVNSFSGVVKGVSVHSCESTKNDWEECMCEAYIRRADLPPVWQKPIPAKDGWIDADTAAMTGKGRASSDAGQQSSPAMKRVTCTASARVTAVVDLYLQVAKEQGVKKPIPAELVGPATRPDQCKSTRGDWDECTCRVLIYHKGLKASLGASAAKAGR